MLALKGRDLASSREITTLLRSFSRSVNPVELVLLLGTYLWSFRVLLGLRMSICGLVKSVFWHRKLFLLALASAKRISELHALSY